MTRSDPSIIEGEFVDYEKPPVTEVICGIQFSRFDNFLAPHVGLLWQKYASRYPIFREMPPLDAVIESFDVIRSHQKIEIMEIPPLPRVWFLDDKENNLIQVQRDRFVHNWKEVKKEDKYPHFANIFDSFKKQLHVFREFLKDHKLGEFKATQYELTYINHIPLGEGWTGYDKLGELFPDFVWRKQSNRFLKNPQIVNWSTAFALPQNTGRLHVAVRSAFRKPDSHPMILLELTVRGIDRNNPTEMDQWFKTAHEWIVKGFSDITSSTVQEKTWLQTR